MNDTSRVLIVDDSAVVRAVVRSYVRGVEMDEAANGVEALQRLRTGNYDVVISDLNMPALDGFGLLAAVKEERLGPEVIILTGSRTDDIDAAVRALRLGAHDFITKPPRRADEVALAVERAIEKKRLRDANDRLVRELEAQTRRDELTGLLNRRAFNQSLADECARATRHGYPLALILLDLDHFKAINDTHGHATGDAVLREFAQLVGSTIRETDFAYRLGGDEFALLLPYATEEGAMKVAERVVEACSRSVSAPGKAGVPIACSVGFAALDATDEEPGDLVHRADRALYGAKRLGRSRAVADSVLRQAPPATPVTATAG